MTPATARAALAQIVVDATGIPAASVAWSRRPRGWIGPQYAVLRLTSYVSVGRDSMEYDYDATRPLGTELHPTEHGLRSLTWEVQLWSHAATDTEDALFLVMALRDRLHLDEVRDALSAAGLGVEGVAGMVTSDVTQDGREMSVATIDVRLHATSEAVGTPIGYVEQWGVEGEATLADGTTETIVGPGVYPS